MGPSGLEGDDSNGKVHPENSAKEKSVSVK